MKNLQQQIKKLASTSPTLRKHLVPLLRQAGDKSAMEVFDTYVWATSNGITFWAEEKISNTTTERVAFWAHNIEIALKGGWEILGYNPDLREVSKRANSTGVMVQTSKGSLIAFQKHSIKMTKMEAALLQQWALEHGHIWKKPR